MEHESFRVIGEEDLFDLYEVFRESVLYTFRCRNADGIANEVFRTSQVSYTIFLSIFGYTFLKESESSRNAS